MCIRDSIYSEVSDVGNKMALIERLMHMKNIMQMMKGQECLYYGEYAAKANISMSHASNLFRMLALKFGFPHKYGVIDNPSDAILEQAIKQIDEEIATLQSQETEMETKAKKSAKKAPKKRKRPKR